MKMRTKLYIGLGVFLLLSYFYFEYNKKEPINWFQSYAAKDKIPFGTYVLKSQLGTILPDTQIETVHEAPYLYLADSTRRGTYFFVNSNLSFGDDEFLRLMEFVTRGNDVFMSTHGMVVDTLKVKTRRLIPGEFETKPFFKLLNTSFNNREFHYDRDVRQYVFSEVDTLNTQVLGIAGYLDNENTRVESGINFIRVKLGKGNFYMHTFPEAFTNYEILKKNQELHSEQLLTYINPELPLLWDAYYKNGKSRITSPMHFVLTNESLKWAYYIFLAGVLIFVVFEGKRKQRAIKVIEPLRNDSIAYTKTIAGMYFESQDHKVIAEKKIAYFLDFIRTKLHLSTTKMDLPFYKLVASRSQNTLDETIALFKYCDQIHTKNSISPEELAELNKRIENFKNTVHHGRQ